MTIIPGSVDPNEGYLEVRKRGHSTFCQYDVEAPAFTTIGTTLDFRNVYGYDHLQRLTSLTQQGQAGASVNAVAEKRIGLAYNAAGQFTSVSRHADLAGTKLVANTFYKYDQYGRLEDMIHTRDIAAPTSDWGADPLAGYHFIYDDASRIYSVSSMVDGLIAFAYDNTNQLTGADYTNASLTDESYSYDANGNRTGGGYETGLNNQLTSDGTYTYLYDAEGNRIRRTKIADGSYSQYFYDHRNRLIGVDEVNHALAQPNANWGWGTSTASGSFEADGNGTSWGWGSSSGGGSIIINEPCGGAEEDPCVDYILTVSVTSATEGGNIVISLNTSRGNGGVDDDLALSVLISGVSATEGIDYEVSGEQCLCVDSTGAGQIIITTIDDAVFETTESISISVSLVDYPSVSVEVEADIFDNDATSSTVNYTFSLPPVVEGEASVHTAWADAAVDFEYSLDAGQTWNSVDASWQASFPTTYDPAATGATSFAVHVRVVDYPETEVILEATVHDREEVTLQTVAYAYDLLNQLVRRTLDDDGPAGENEPVDTFFSWEAGQIALEFEGGASAVPAHRYLFNPMAVDQLLADENTMQSWSTPGEVLWALTDHLGTVRDLANYDPVADETTIVNHRRIDSYGNQTAPDNAYTTLFRFTGVMFDTATGLQYNRNRWYDPAVGKWISEDPIGFGGEDTNVRRYVGNSPINNIDPDGLKFKVLTLYYDFMWRTPPSAQVKAEVQRIFDDLMRRYGAKKGGKPCHTFRINWAPLPPNKTIKDIAVGFSDNPTRSLQTVTIEDTYEGKGEGQSGGSRINLKGKVLAGAPNSDWSIAMSIAHEMIHAVLGMKHVHKSGFVDAEDFQNERGKKLVFSNDAGDAFDEKWKLSTCD